MLATIVCEQLQQPLWKMRIHRPFLEVHRSCICMLSLSADRRFDVTLIQSLPHAAF